MRADRSLRRNVDHRAGRPEWMTIVVVAVATACDPAAYLRLRQPATPPGLHECVAAALDRSPLVETERRVTTSLSFNVSFPDLVVPDTWKRATVSLETDDDSVTGLTLEYSWVPNAEGDPTPAQQERMIAAGTALIDELRTQCLPSVPANVSCSTGTPLLWSNPCIP